MAHTPIRTRRCKRAGCNRMITQRNKSGYCSGHSPYESKMRKERKFCSICKEPCSGKMLIEVVKGRYVSLCTYHFNILNLIDDPKELRKRIKYLRSYH